MSTETMSPPNVSESIAQTKQAVDAAQHQLLTTFGFVPDDKLNWSPSESARTPAWIVGHCGMANKAFAAILRGEELDMPASPEEASEQIRKAGKDITSREAAVQLLEESVSEVQDALGKVTAEKMATSPMSPFGPFPFTFWMSLPADHMSCHANQIDYIQTIWGDLEDHR